MRIAHQSYHTIKTFTLIQTHIENRNTIHLNNVIRKTNKNTCSRTH